jgi:hypothetical protein
MKTVKQTKTTKTHGTGNCMEAAIASICEVDIEKIGDLYSEAKQFWPKMAQAFSNNYKEGGWVLDEIIDHSKIKTDEYYFAIGLTNRGNEHHVVIYKDGKAVFDPHQDNTFLIGDPIYYLVPIKVNLLSLSNTL